MKGHLHHFKLKFIASFLSLVLLAGSIPALTFAETVEGEALPTTQLAPNTDIQQEAAASTNLPDNTLMVPFSLSPQGDNSRTTATMTTSAGASGSASTAAQQEPYVFAEGSAPVKKEILLTNDKDQQVKLVYADHYYRFSKDERIYFEVTGLKTEYLYQYDLIFTDPAGKELRASNGGKVNANVNGFYADSNALFGADSVTDSVYQMSAAVSLVQTSYDGTQVNLYASNGQSADFTVTNGLPFFYAKSYIPTDCLTASYSLKIYGDPAKLPFDDKSRDLRIGFANDSGQDAVDSLVLSDQQSHSIYYLPTWIPFYNQVFENAGLLVATNVTYLSGKVVFVTPSEDGEAYALHVTQSGGQPEVVLPGILQATGNPIINSISQNARDYPVAAPGVESFYIYIEGSGFKPDRLNIRLVDNNNPSLEIAHAEQYRYEFIDRQKSNMGIAIQMVVAEGAVLQSNHFYALAITPKDEGQPIYNYSMYGYQVIPSDWTRYYGMEPVEDEPYADFMVYAAVSSKDEGKEVRAELLRNGTSVGSTKAALSPSMRIPFYDSADQLLKLYRNSSYQIQIYSPGSENVEGYIFYNTGNKGFKDTSIGGGEEREPQIISSIDNYMVRPLRETIEEVTISIKVRPALLDGDYSLELINPQTRTIVSTISSQALKLGEPVEETFLTDSGPKQYSYIPINANLEIPAGLADGQYTLLWVGSTGNFYFGDCFLYQDSKTYSYYQSAYSDNTTVNIEMTIMKTRTLDPSAFSVRVYDLLGKEIQGIQPDIRLVYEGYDTDNFKIKFDLPRTLTKGYYQVHLLYDNEPVYSSRNTAQPVSMAEQSYFELNLDPSYETFSRDSIDPNQPETSDTAVINAVFSNIPENAKIKATVYSGSIIKTTEPIGQLEMVKTVGDMGPNYDYYGFTPESLANLDLSKRYSLVFFLDNQPLGVLSSVLLKPTEQFPVTGISLSSSAVSLNVGQEATLTATIAPANASDKTVTWSSSNSAVATVDAAGKVYASGVGNATITAKAGSHTATATITVKSSGGGGGGYAGPGPASSSNQTVKLGDLAITPKVDDKQNYAFAPTADEFAKLVGQNGQAKTELSLQFAGLPADAKGVDLAFKAEWLPEKTERLVISAPEIGTWTMGSDTLKQLFVGKNVSLSLRKGSLKAELLIDGKAYTTENEQQPFRFSMPYEIKAGEQVNTLVVVRVKDNGEKQILPRSSYDSAKKAMTFLSPATGYFEVVANSVALADVPADAWYKPAIDYMAAHDTLSVKAGQKFMPKQDITRGEFVVMLMKTLGFSPDTQLADNFSDAGNGDAAGYLAAAKRQGLITGVGNNRFAPNERISRQDMFVILYQALEKISLLPAEGKGQNLARFQDAASVADYSRKALGYFVSAGVVSGNGKLILPKSNTTKAEAAQVLYNIFAKAN